ncbi:Multi-drug ABC transporter ATP-binding protein and permease [Alkalihalophilus pseudofirmus OF4]|uniref:Multi-drug ABC transporter ATP-binding protein and permease n=1 Tax=Alkalihalophilus pseudofirmus (strain ATCC BAA-2126 / JCM 17055 / OF4) TaxID=398511 RepID=D3FTN7_ALKPO|nr:ABC transporter ATP-binding protein [Alkalihalophilus pseudofirmus]ADC50110.1 Multi-drug ABC transporter ATP-binding protein and permease [Alkalihalophilus pseudofirmus OF4]
MRKIFAFIKPYRFPMWIAIVLMLVELAVELFHPLLLARIIDEGVVAGDIDIVIRWGLIMIGMSFLAFLSGVINSFYAAHVSQSTGFDLRQSMYTRVQSFAYSKLQNFETSSLITRMTNDVTQIQNTIFMSLRIMMRAPLLVIGGTIMAFVVNAKLALFLVVTIPILIFFLIWMMKKGGSMFREVQNKLDQLNHVMRENLKGIRIIKAFVRRNHEGKRFNKDNEQLKDQTIKALRLMEVTMPVLLLLMNGAIIGVLWFGAIDVGANQAQVGEVVAIINYATRITSALTVFSMIIIVFSRARASAARIDEVLSTETGMEDGDIETAIEQSKQSDTHIEFNHVTFNYPRSQKDVLKDLSFYVKRGETVAILGATGSGKSSLFQLIPRLYDPKKGSISIDGIDLREWEMGKLRQMMGYVPQESLLFTGSIKENLSWGRKESTEREMEASARAAQIHDTIAALPKQYETRIGQKGVNLSGGQKQRISIARALIRQPCILLLDDSTSALDMKTERKFLKALEEYPCTTLIITQKIKTAMAADRIFLLDQGRMLACGSHEELLKDSDLYQQIAQSQLGKEETHHV